MGENMNQGSVVITTPRILWFVNFAAHKSKKSIDVDEEREGSIGDNNKESV